MANYVVYLSFTGGKGSNAEFRYPDTSTTTGTGHVSTNRLELVAGDTVEFRGVPGSAGGGTIDGFASGFWTNTSSLSYIGSISPFLFGTKTVASGTSGTDDISVTPSLVGSVTDNFYFEKVAPPITAPTASNVTVNDPESGTYTATFTLSAGGSGGTLEYAIEKNDSTPDNWTAAASDSQTVFTADFSRSDPPGTIYAQARRSVTDTSSIVSVAGRNFIDPANVTVSDKTLGYGNTSTYTTDLTGGIATKEAYAVSQTSGLASANVISNSIDVLNPYSSGGFDIPFASLPSSGANDTYYVYSARFGTYGGSGTFTEVDSFTVTRIGTPSAAPTSRDHCKSEWACMVNSTNRTINYMAPNPSTVIKKRTSGGTVSTILTTGTTPTAGTILGTEYAQGTVYYGEKSNGDPEAVYFFGGGDQQQSIVPTSLKGQKFVSYNNRNAPATHYIWSDTSQTIAVFDNVSGGIKTGDPTSTISLTANTVSSYQTSTLSAYVFFTGTSDFIMSKTSNGADRNIMAPMSDAVYSARRFSSFPGIAEDGADGSNVSGTYYAADATDQIMRHGIGDGAGADSESALGTQNLSDVYLWGQVLSDFVIVAPFTGTILIERWGSSSAGWIVEETFNPTGTATSPTAYIRAAVDGFGVQSSVTSGALGSPLYFSGGATLWRWRGTGNFYLRNNYITDEEMVLGYTKDFDDVFNITGPKTLASYENSVSYSVTNGNAITTDYALFSGSPPTSKGLTLTGDLGSSGELPSALDGGTVEFTKRWSRSGDNLWADPLYSSNDGKKLIVGKLGYIRFSDDSQAPGSGKFLARDQQIAGIGTTYNEDGTVLSDSETVVSTYGEGVAVRTTGGQTLTSGSYTSSATIKNNEYLYLRTNQASEPGEKARASAVVADVHLYTMTLTLNRTLDSSNDYGIKIFDTDGTTVVLGPDTRYIKVLAIETINIAAGSSQLIECDTTDLTAYNSDLIITNGGQVSSSIVGSEKPFTLSLGASGYTITANSNNTANLTGNAIVIGF